MRNNIGNTYENDDNTRVKSCKLKLNDIYCHVKFNAQMSVSNIIDIYIYIYINYVFIHYGWSDI